MGSEKPCVFCTRIRELLLYTGLHPGRYDHSDMFAKVAPLPPDKMPIGTVSVSAGNDNESAIKKKKSALFAPVVPLSFVLAYQMDMAYGTLIYRMRGEAESIMVSEHDRLDLPHGVPNFESIEKARRAKNALGSLFEK